MFDVVIIGAGVVGGMVARALSAYELSVCILEAENDVAMGATKANSAIVHAGFDAKEGTLKARLNVRGSEMMEDICRDLGVKYKRNGSMVIGFTEEDERVLSELLERGERNGVRGLRLISGEEARELEPNLSESVTSALLAESGAIVCPYELTLASVGIAMDNGAELKRNYKVVKIEKQGEKYTVYSERGEAVECRYVVNAAGCYSEEISTLLNGKTYSVHPRRGEYMLLDKECGTLVGHTIFRTPTKMGKGILVTPTVDGNLLLGPTSVDIEDKADKRTSAEGFSKIISEAKENVPTIPFNKVITSFTGIRAVGDTGDFIIKIKDRFIDLGGIESPGLSASPAIAEEVVSLMKNDGEVLKKRASLITKREPMHAFREADIEGKQNFIRKDKSYGRIVCRCEGVTEGEILNAIRTNPKPLDLDGVKRRTRAQMGRCQGGFCSPYIIELLAKELGIPEKEVTKFGGASRIIVGVTKGEEDEM